MFTIDRLLTVGWRRRVGPRVPTREGFMSDAQIYRVVIGTAGHIDHGKSSVVRRLTGVDPDRLPEERDRGLTIDLGFAPMQLSTGETVGIIDVPGHEKFIKNMVAGASGIDLVVLVVAADDSVMPQTREHLEIMSLLQVKRGLIVVNKIDLVEEDLLELVEEEVRESVAETFLADAPIFRVSAVRGDGIEEFRSALEAMVHEVPPRDESGIFRMPIQRVFSAKGHGTVVTGIPMSGGVSTGDQVEILPLGENGTGAWSASVQSAGRAGSCGTLHRDEPLRRRLSRCPSGNGRCDSPATSARPRWSRRSCERFPV